MFLNAFGKKHWNKAAGFPTPYWRVTLTRLLQLFLVPLSCFRPLIGDVFLNMDELIALVGKPLFPTPNWGCVSYLEGNTKLSKGDIVFPTPYWGCVL